MKVKINGREFKFVSVLHVTSLDGSRGSHIIYKDKGIENFMYFNSHSSTIEITENKDDDLI